jgi:hypothetical protein
VIGRSSLTSGADLELAVYTLSTGWAAGIEGNGGSGGRAAPTVSAADAGDVSKAVEVRRIGMRRMEKR